MSTTNGPELTKYPNPPKPTPPAKPFPTPTPKPYFNPETTKQPGPLIYSAGGIPIYDARSIITADAIGPDRMMDKQVIMIKASEFEKVVSFDDPSIVPSVSPDQYKGIKVFITHPSFLGKAMIKGTKYYLVNENIAKAIGSSSGGVTIPLNVYGDMFSPKSYKPIGKEKLLVDHNHGFLYFIITLMFLSILAVFLVKRR